MPNAAARCSRRRRCEFELLFLDRALLLALTTSIIDSRALQTKNEAAAPTILRGKLRQAAPIDAANDAVMLRPNRVRAALLLHLLLLTTTLSSRPRDRYLINISVTDIHT